jgi:hypothetical protein
MEFENEGTMPSDGDLAALRKALEAAGVQFLEEDSEGEGVRFRKKKRGGT